MFDDHLISIWTMLGTVVAPLVAAISVIIYVAQLRQLKWSANQELMKVMIELDKLIIQFPQYYWVVWPDRTDSVSPILDDPKLKAIVYFHFNLFDMAYGYYTRILRVGRRFKVLLNKKEQDDWEGWKRYIGNFMAQDYVAELFRAESAKWFSPGFIEFVYEQIAEIRKEQVYRPEARTDDL